MAALSAFCLPLLVVGLSSVSFSAFYLASLLSLLLPSFCCHCCCRRDIRWPTQNSNVTIFQIFSASCIRKRLIAMALLWVTGSWLFLHGQNTLIPSSQTMLRRKFPTVISRILIDIANGFCLEVKKYVQLLRYNRRCKFWWPKNWSQLWCHDHNRPGLWVAKTCPDSMPWPKVRRCADHIVPSSAQQCSGGKVGSKKSIQMVQCGAPKRCKLVYNPIV